ncbi:MAG: hypothetical protein HQK87_07810 [Nitrospinae bacterium]|nr:hypothetical protein [Nitrospinota bacterium]
MRKAALAALLLLAFPTGADAAKAPLWAADDPLGRVTVTEEQETARRTISVNGQPVAWTGDGSDRMALTPSLILPRSPSAWRISGRLGAMALAFSSRRAAVS